jgi:hypothetical protein
MTTKLQAKAIKAEIRKLERETRADTATTSKAITAIKRQIAALAKEKERLIAAESSRIGKRDKRIAILNGRL